MARIEDSPELFGCGVGTSTNLHVHCEFCGQDHNVEFKGVDPDTISHEGDSVLTTYFAGKEIADCCFEKIENEILRRMPDILLWYAGIVQRKRSSIERAEKYIRDVLKALGEK